jgi:hypothetical protein
MTEPVDPELCEDPPLPLLLLFSLDFYEELSGFLPSLALTWAESCSRQKAVISFLLNFP